MNVVGFQRLGIKKNKKCFENLVLAHNVQDGTQKKGFLLNYLGDEAYDIYKNLSTGRPNETYDAVIAFFNNVFRHKIALYLNVIYFKMSDQIWMRIFINCTYV